MYAKPWAWLSVHVQVDVLLTENTELRATVLQLQAQVQMLTGRLQEHEARGAAGMTRACSDVVRVYCFLYRHIRHCFAL